MKLFSARSATCLLLRCVGTVAPMICFVSQCTQWQTPRKCSSGTAAGLVMAASGGPVMVLSSCDNDGDTMPLYLRYCSCTAHGDIVEASTAQASGLRPSGKSIDYVDKFGS